MSTAPHRQGAVFKDPFLGKSVIGQKKLFSQAVPGLPDGLFKPKIEISVNFGGSGR
jgi:hypothetical protein